MLNMLLSTLRRLTGITSRWGYLFILVGVNFLVAQSTDEIILQLGLDEEEAPTEEDIVILESVCNSQQALSVTVKQLIELSFLSDTDIQVLKTFRKSSPINNLLNHPLSSDRLRILLKMIMNRAEDRVYEFRISQTVVKKTDLRYRWRGQIVTPFIEAGIFFERDPGEIDIMDRKSGYIAGVHPAGKWILGDHQIISGYGLLSWRSTPSYKGFETVRTLTRNGRGLVPFRSSHESWNFRGVGLTWESNFGNWLLSLGKNPRDGTIDSAGVINISDTGLHNTEQSVKNKGRLIEATTIGQWELYHSSTLAGATISNVKWTYLDKHREEQIYSIYGRYQYNYWTFFGERAFGYRQTDGAIIGILYKTNHFRYLVSARSFSKGYQSLRSNPISEWTGKRRNEQGVYQGVNFKIGSIVLTLYGDFFRQYESSNHADFPNKGSEVACRLEWKKRKYTLRIQSKQEKQFNGKTTFLLDSHSPLEILKTTKFVSSFSIADNIKVKCQYSLAKATMNGSTEYGSGINFRGTFGLGTGTLTFDWVSAQVNSFRTRVYFWDVNLPGEMRSRMYTNVSRSAAVKYLINNGNGFRTGYRMRVFWEGNGFEKMQDTEGAFIVEFIL